MKPRRYFYPRPPRGGRLLALEGSAGLHPFLSTPSARRATEFGVYAWDPDRISIHALREEGDHLRPVCKGVIAISIHALREEGDHRHAEGHRQPAHFYPRPPRGGRPVQTSRSVCTKRFLSTPSARRATSKAKYGRILCVISIHALREEGDARSSPKQPRSKISIHALREEGDGPCPG